MVFAKTALIVRWALSIAAFEKVRREKRGRLRKPESADVGESTEKDRGPRFRETESEEEGIERDRGTRQKTTKSSADVKESPKAPTS